MAYGETEGYLMIDDPNGRYLGEFSGINLANGVQTMLRFTHIQENYSISKAAQYSSSTVLGRSEPIRGYSNSGPRVLSLSLKVPPDDSVHASNETPQAASGIWYDDRLGVYMGGGMEVPGYQDRVAALVQVNTQPDRDSQTAALMRQKWAKIDFLQSLVYPYYDNTSAIILPPPPVLVMIGTWLSMRGIVTSINFTHHAPYDVSTMTPYYTDVNLTIEEADQPYSFQDILTGKQRENGYRSDRSQGSEFESYLGTGMSGSVSNNGTVKGTDESGKQVATDPATAALEALPWKKSPFSFPTAPALPKFSVYDQFKPKARF